MRTISSPEVSSSLIFSLYIATVTILVAVISALFLSFRLLTEIRHQWFSTILYFPLAIPAVVAAFFTFQVLSKAGLLSRVVFQAGWIPSLEQFPDLINDRFGVGIIATHVMMSLPFFTILFSALYDAEKIEELHRLAQTLGATETQASLKVGVPILFHRAFPTIILYF